MADSYKDIIITPNRSNTADPKIDFRGGNSTVNTTITITMYPDANGTLSFDGSVGQLFSITNDLSGVLWSVNDISGMPSAEVYANGSVRLAEFSGNVSIGTATNSSKLFVNGNSTVNGSINVTSTMAAGNTTITGFANVTTTATVGTGFTLTSGNANFDSGVLFVDGTNNRVGIGNTTPGHALSVTGTTNLGGAVTGITTLAAGNTTITGTLSASNFSGSSSGTNTGDQTNISGNAGTATTLQTARTITVGSTGRSFNGSADISWSLADIGAATNTHTHGLVRHSLAAPALIDGLTNSNFRTTLFGSSTSGYQLSTARWDTSPSVLGLQAYSTMFAWAGADTHGFLAVNYNTAGVRIGGGNGDAINWSKAIAFADGTGASGTWSINVTGSAGSVPFNNLTSKTSGTGTYTTSGDFRAPIFYDQENTAYYANPNGSSFFNALGLNSNLDVYGQTYIRNNLNILNTAGNDWNTLIDRNGGNTWIVYGGDSVRAPVFYDKDNTAYYVDPNSTTNINALTVVGLIQGRSSGSTDVNSANDTGSISIRGSTTTVAAMSFHRSGAYAINMGLGTDNVFRIGGWSASSNAFQMTGTGDLTMLGNITAYSDERLKTDIAKIENAVEKVQAINGYSYTRTDTGSKHIGVIAQEVMKVIPEVVMGSEDTHYSVAYGNMVGLLIEAIKEQQDHINRLETKINSLQGK